MVVKYFVIGFRRYKTKEEFINKVVKHNNRLANNLAHVNYTKTKNNIVLQKLKFNSLNNLLDYAKQNLQKGKRQLKKGAAWGFEFVVDCTPNPDWKNKNYIVYLEEAEAYLKNRFKRQEVISSVIHVDEGKPHLHIVFSYFNKNLGKWNQRGMKEQKIDRLTDLLEDFEVKVGKKFGLKKGTKKEIDKPIKKMFANKIKEVKVKEGLLKTTTQKVITLEDLNEVIRNINNNTKINIKTQHYIKNLKGQIQSLQEQIQNKNLEIESFINLESKNNLLQQQIKDKDEKLDEANKKIKDIEYIEKELIEAKSKLSKTPIKSKQIVKNQVETKYNIGGI